MALFSFAILYAVMLFISLLSLSLYIHIFNSCIFIYDSRVILLQICDRFSKAFTTVINKIFLFDTKKKYTKRIDRLKISAINL